MLIHPALLVTTKDELQRQLNAAAGFATAVDIDLIDWDRHEKKTLSLEDALSCDLHEDKLEINFDLMQDYPLAAVSKLVMDPRVNRIIVNVHAKDELNMCIANIIHYGKKAGISLNPGDEIHEYLYLLSSIGLVQLMTVEPGAQGNPLTTAPLEQTRELKALNFDGLIEIDGGVNFDTAKLVRDYPIDVVSVGSAISQAVVPEEVYEQLLEILNSKS